LANLALGLQAGNAADSFRLLKSAHEHYARHFVFDSRGSQLLASKIPPIPRSQPRDPSSQFPVPSWRCESSPLLSAAKTRLKRKHSTFHCRSASSRVDLICKLRPLYRLSWDWDWEWDWDLDWDWDSWVRFSDTIHDRKLAMPMPPIEQAPCVIQSA